MRLHKEFVGGNISLEKWEGDHVHLHNELRDSDEWFYWAFCLEGAQGRTLTFHMQRNRVGYFGPAVSHDLKEWHWLGEKRVEENGGDSFTYTFGPEEDRVYFAHHTLYHPDRFFTFAKGQGLEVKTLCTSRGGREVPYTLLGEGEKCVLLTARHHCCESTGSYVLEGVLEVLSGELPCGWQVMCVPFVDYDGTLEGDQGKARRPFGGHNQDYRVGEASVYPSVAAIRKYVDSHSVLYGFDFHSPWHMGGRNDTPFIVQKDVGGHLDAMTAFGRRLEANITPASLPYRQANDIPPGVEWNISTPDSPMCSIYLLKKPENRMAFTLETTYFGTPKEPFTPEKGVELGRCFARTLLEEMKQ